MSASSCFNLSALSASSSCLSMFLIASLLIPRSTCISWSSASFEGTSTSSAAASSTVSTISSSTASSTTSSTSSSTISGSTSFTLTAGITKEGSILLDNLFLNGSDLSAFSSIYAYSSMSTSAGTVLFIVAGVVASTQDLLSLKYLHASFQVSSSINFLSFIIAVKKSLKFSSPNSPATVSRIAPSIRLLLFKNSNKTVAAAKSYITLPPNPYASSASRFSKVNILLNSSSIVSLSSALDISFTLLKNSISTMFFSSFCSTCCFSSAVSSFLDPPANILLTITIISLFSSILASAGFIRKISALSSFLRLSSLRVIVKTSIYMFKTL